MKTFLFFVSFLMTFVVQLTEVRANPQGPGKTVAPIQVNGLGNFRGKYLTVLYGIGSMSTLAGQADQVTLRIVKAQTTKLIEGDSVQVPASPLLTWNGVLMPYNLVVFVVHHQDSFGWVNADGGVPENSDGRKYHSPLLVNSIRNTQIERLQGSPDFRGLLQHQMIY